MTEPAIIDTSVAAYEAVKPKVPSIRARVLQYITDFNGQGVSRTEIAKALDVHEITVGSRITELLQSGKVKRKGETVRSTNGKQEHLYVLGDGIPTEKPNKGKGAQTITPKRMAGILNAAQPRESVLGFFVWSASPEGHDYWAAVEEEFKRIGHTNADA